MGAAWVRQRLGDVVLLDVRYAMDGTDAHAAYLAGHLPGAVWVDLDQHLAAAPTVEGGRHPLPTPEAFAASMASLGVGDDSTVVAHDQGNGAFAARLVWMLRVTGHEAALLDGGVDAWPGPLESGDVRPEPATFARSPWPDDAMVDIDDVAAASATRDHSIVDARAAPRFRGDVEPLDARAGHIPGAVNLPYADLVDDEGRLLPTSQLARRFQEHGLGDEPVIVYCGSGVTACLDVLALELAGIEARLYPGSWSQWSGRAELPVATGE